MHVILECLAYALKLLYITIEGVIIACLPASLCRKKDVSGQNVLVTGSGSGLGRLMSVEFAKLGSTLILWDVNGEANEGTAKLVREKGVSVYTYTVDLSDRTAIYSAAARVKKEVGDVDILINNAGIVTGKRFLDCPDALVEKTMAVNVHAHFWTVKSFLPVMIERNHGHIVNIASSAGLFGANYCSDYCASKFAAVGFDESLRAELTALGKNGVKTTVICPYFINTGMFEGVTTRFPSVLPILEPDFVVKKTMEAILTNQVMLLTPFVMYVFYTLKGLLPSKGLLLSSQFFGINNSMADFQGRKKED